MNDITFFWFALGFYLGGFLLFTAYLARESRKIARMATIFMGVGFAVQTVAIVLRWKLSGHPPLANMFEYMLTMSWMATLSFLALNWKFKRPVIGCFISPVVFLLMVSASLLPKEVSKQLIPALQDVWLYIHVSLAAMSEGAFAVAFGVSVMYLVRSKVSSPGDSLVKRFPSPEVLEEINYKAISVGFPLFTVGALFAGAIWASKAWGSFWSWDPKEVSSLIIWIFYALHLHARHQRKWQGTRAAWLSIIGFFMVLLSFFGNSLLGGLHAY